MERSAVPSRDSYRRKTELGKKTTLPRTAPVERGPSGTTATRTRQRLLTKPRTGAAGGALLCTSRLVTRDASGLQATEGVCGAGAGCASFYAPAHTRPAPPAPVAPGHALRAKARSNVGARLGHYNASGVNHRGHAPPRPRPSRRAPPTPPILEMRRLRTRNPGVDPRRLSGERSGFRAEAGGLFRVARNRSPRVPGL